MAEKDRFQKRYQSGDTPWDLGEEDFNLIETVTVRPIPAGRALELGCGKGDNSIWLAGQGFSVVALDASELAVGEAREKAAAAGVEVDLRVIDFMSADFEGGPFDFIFDRGFFHVFASARDRVRCAGRIADLLRPDGLWLSIIGNADEDRKSPGPPQRTATDIVLAVDPSFEILSLAVSHFGSKRSNPPRAWCLLTKRRA